MPQHGLTVFHAMLVNNASGQGEHHHRVSYICPVLTSVLTDIVVVVQIVLLLVVDLRAASLEHLPFRRNCNSVMA